MKALVAHLQAMGIVVVAAIADNAANAQKYAPICVNQMLIIFFLPRVVRESAGLNLNCQSHVLNLTIRDLAAVFLKNFEQAKEVEAFFRSMPILNFSYF